MNRVVQPVGPSEEGLDALLGAFFRSEMPSPWPAFETPRARTLPFRPALAPRKRRGYFAGASRLALVASVALLLLAAWLMPRGPSLLSSYRLKMGSEEATPRHGRELSPELQKNLLPPLPDIKSLPGDDDPKGAGKLKSSLQLEQKDGKTGIKITVEELPSDK